MKCVILAAGYATRLAPLTDNFPKPLLTVGGKAILDYLVDDISQNCAISHFILVSNHKYFKIFNDWAKKKTQAITVIDDGSESNETRLGAVKDILFAIQNQNIDEDMMVIAGDNVLDFSFGFFTRFFAEKKTTCIMRYYQEELKKDKRYCVCHVDGDKVTEMHEKILNPESHWLVPPFYIFRREDLPFFEKALKEGCPKDAPGSFIEWLASHAPIHAMEMPGSRYDIGDIESYRNVCSTYKGITIF